MILSGSGLVLVYNMASGITLHYAVSAARIVHARELVDDED